MKIALAGNPNSGKTTLFNAITGKIEHVGNWAGVTVEKKEGRIKKELASGKNDLIVVDLPGAYSMSPYTNEESITRDFVVNENPDVIINIVDATNLNRSLLLTTQLLELGIPLVIALNKTDMSDKKGDKINNAKLEQALHCKVVSTIATKGSNNGLKELISAAEELYNKGHKQKKLEIAGLSGDDKSAFEEADKKRFKFINGIISDIETKKATASHNTKQDAVDRIVANKWLGIPIFAAVMWFVFKTSQEWVGPWLADTLVGWIEGFQEYVGESLGESVSPFLSSLLVDGIIGGVGAVVGFLPLIMVLFFLLALLEDSGYMARVAVVMDRFFKKVGLSGKSIIPMIVGIGCSIPAVMATRTIKNERQRRTTAMLSPFMPCGAKLPIIALFAGVFFAGSSWVSVSMYFLAIVVIFLSAIIVRKITGDTSQSYFIIELPEYRWPSVKRAIISMFDRAKAFIIKAGTIILICNAVIQTLQTFNWSLEVVEEGMENTSILASIAGPVAILLIPLGFGIWQFGAAAVTGFIAKENVVGTLAVTFAITNFIDPEEFELIGEAAGVSNAFGITAVAGLSFLVFNLFTPPCFAAIGAMNSELESKKWLFGAIAFQLGTGYTLAFLTYQIGTLATAGSLGQGFVGGLIAVVIMVSILVYFVNKGTKLAKAGAR